MDGHSYSKFLVKSSGHWRLYLNGINRKAVERNAARDVAFQLGKERFVGRDPIR